MTNDSLPPRLAEYIKETLPWAHGHQRKAITTFVAAIFDKQTGCQAALARTLGNQEADINSHARRPERGATKTTSRSRGARFQMTKRCRPIGRGLADARERIEKGQREVRMVVRL